MKREEENLGTLLRSVIPPITDSAVQRDLWPDILRKLDTRMAPPSWRDWALLALLGGWVLFYPEGLLQLLYHL
jgi:hypothetical protein